MKLNLKTRAIVLSRVNYGEADRVLCVITPSNGELAVMAKGVRREKSRLAGGIELLAVCEFGLVKGVNNKSGMWTLTSARIVEFYGNIMRDYERLTFAYEALKRVKDLGEFIDAPELYDATAGSLRALNDDKMDLRLIKAWLYLRLAKLRGGELNLRTDSSGALLREDRRYEFSAGERSFIPAEDGRYGASEIKLLRLLSANGAKILPRLRVPDSTMSAALYLANVALESC